MKPGGVDDSDSVYVGSVGAAQVFYPEILSVRRDSCMAGGRLFVRYHDPVVFIPAYAQWALCCIKPTTPLVDDFNFLHASSLALAGAWFAHDTYLQSFGGRGSKSGPAPGAVKAPIAVPMSARGAVQAITRSLTHQFPALFSPACRARLRVPDGRPGSPPTASRRPQYCPF